MQKNEEFHNSLENIVSFQAVSKLYGKVTALEEISFDVVKPSF